MADRYHVAFKEFPWLLLAFCTYCDMFVAQETQNASIYMYIIKPHKSCCSFVISQ